MALFSLGAKLTEKVSLSTVAKYSAMEMEESINRSRTTSEQLEAESVTSDGETESNAESEFSDRNAVGYLTMLSTLIWNAPVERKPSYCSGVDSWVPFKPDQIAELPEALTSHYKKVYPLMGDDLEKNGSFSVISDIATKNIFEEYSSSNNSTPPLSRDPSRAASPVEIDQTPPTSPNIYASRTSVSSLDQPAPPLKPPLHHLIITFWKGSQQNKHVLSLFRSRRVTDVIALCERCRECRDLFKINPKNMEQHVYLSELIVLLKKNLLWKSAHIAAAMGILEYFKPATRAIKSTLHVFCQPEGMTPLLIAVQNNRVTLVQYLLTLSLDMTVLDVNNNNILHLAATTSEEMIKLLMDTGKCSDLLNIPNVNGCSPLYLSVTGAHAYCAKAFKAYGASFTAIPRASGQNPLLDLMKKNKFDVTLMKAILDSNPKAIEEMDSVTGNGVLHTAMYKKPLIALLQLKAREVHLEARNCQMQTPLHIYVQKQDLSLVMAICAFNADLNAKDNNGNTPLHLAVSGNNLEIVRLLLCLGAEPNAINNHYETPRHLAAKMKDDRTAKEIIKSLIICGARTCKKGFLGCTVACVHKDNYVTEPKSMVSSNPSSSSLSAKKDEDTLSKTSVDPNAPTAMYEFEIDPDSHEIDPAYSEPNPVRSFPQEGAIQNVLAKLKRFAEEKKDSNIISVLALDGGGIKGLVIVQILIALEKLLDQPLMNYFDWIGGTSTGSYVAGGATTGNTLRVLQKTYLRFKDAIFDSWSRPYSAEILEGFLKQLFGDETKLADIKYPKVFFTTVRADTFPVQLDLLRNYRLPITEDQNNELGFEDPSGIQLWRAARRSSAAPTYFPSSEGKYIDGGMVSNNPTLDLLSEVSFWNSVCKYVDSDSPYTVDVGCVVSVGTGITPVSPVDPSLFEMNDMFGMLRGLKNLSLMVLDQATATEGAPIGRSRSWCHSLGIPYFRLNAPLFKDIMLDSKEDPDLVKMMWDVVVYTYTHRKDFEELASILKAIGTNKNRKRLHMTIKAPSILEEAEAVSM